MECAECCDKEPNGNVVAELGNEDFIPREESANIIDMSLIERDRGEAKEIVCYATASRGN